MKQGDYVKHFDMVEAVGIIRQVLPNTDVVVDWHLNGRYFRTQSRQLDLTVIPRPED